MTANCVAQGLESQYLLQEKKKGSENIHRHSACLSSTSTSTLESANGVCADNTQLLKVSFFPVGKHLPCKTVLREGFADPCLHSSVIYKALLSWSKTDQQKQFPKRFHLGPELWVSSEWLPKAVFLKLSVYNIDMPVKTADQFKFDVNMWSHGYTQILFMGNSNYHFAFCP